MAFVPRTEAEIRQALSARVLAYTQLTDLHEGGVALELLAALAKELGRAEVDLQQVANLLNIDRTTGQDLDERAAEVLPDGEERQPATKATSTVKFRRSATDTVGATTIPAGQVVSRSSDGTLYQTTAAATVLNGGVESGAVEVIALTAGSAANGGAGTIDVVKSPPSRIVGVTNYTTISGGLDEESDPSLRNRVRNKSRSLARCNPAAIDLLVRAFTNGAGQKVRFLRMVEAPPRADLWIDDGTGALDVAETVASGEVLIESAPDGETVLFLSRQAIKSPPAGLLVTPLAGPAYTLTNNVDFTVERAWGQVVIVGTGLTLGDKVETLNSYTAYTGLVSDVQRLLDGDPYDRVTTPGCRASGTATRVRPATSQLQAITLDVTWRSGIGETALANASAAVSNAVLGLVNNIDIGQPLYTAALIDVAMEIDGVQNVKVTTPAADVYVAVHRVVRTTSDLITVR